MITEGQEAGQFAKGDAFDLAQTVVSATNSLLPYNLSAVELGERTELAAKAQKTADLLIRGLMWLLSRLPFPVILDLKVKHRKGTVFDIAA